MPDYHFTFQILTKKIQCLTVVVMEYPKMPNSLAPPVSRNVPFFCRRGELLGSIAPDEKMH